VIAILPLFAPLGAKLVILGVTLNILLLKNAPDGPQNPTKLVHARSSPSPSNLVLTVNPVILGTSGQIDFPSEERYFRAHPILF
jgi:hypothetical protein